MSHAVKKLHKHYQHLEMYRHLIFFLTVLDGTAAVVCFLVLGLITKSAYLWFPGAVAIMDLLAWFFVQLSMKLWIPPEKQRKSDDRTGLMIVEDYLDDEVEYMVCSLWGTVRRDPKHPGLKIPIFNPIPLWRRWKYIRFILLLILVIRPIALNRSYFLPPVGSSSCTRNGDAPAGSVYNPQGFFPHGSWEVFSTSQTYVFCVLGRTWAVPVAAHYIKGFELTPPNTLECNRQEVGGYVDIDGQCQSENPFPDPTIGLNVPLLRLPNTTTANQDFCPGNNLGSMCLVNGVASTTCSLDSPIVTGRPSYICPYCLPCWQQRVSETGGTVTSFGYEDCPVTNPSATSCFGCNFCPGLGYGWLAHEVVSDQAFTTAYWTSLVYNVFVPATEIVSWWLGVSYIKFRKRKLDLKD